MIISADQIVEMHDHIKACAASSSDAITVLILVAVDTDAVCACAMLTKLLEQDEVSHKVKPVRDYNMLTDIFMNDVVGDGELRNIVLLNCGGIISINEELQTKLDAEDSDRPGGVRSVKEALPLGCRLWIIDSHRPHNLANAMDGERITLIGLDEPTRDLISLLDMAHVLEDTEFEDEEDDLDESRPVQRQRVGPAEYAQMSPDSRAAQYHAMQRLAKRYYSVTWFGPASSMVLHMLVSELGRSSNPMVWLAAVGLTDQLVHERVKYEDYVKMAQKLQVEVASLNQDGGVDTIEVHDAVSKVTVSVGQHIHAGMRLESVQELRLSLLRHWTLLDAMRNSPYVAARLGLWSKKGSDNLKTMMCRMGIPLDEGGQTYAYMRPETRQKLHYAITLYGSEYGLLNLDYPSVRRMTRYGLNSTMSAADMVYCIDAQLEAPPPGRIADDATADELREAEDAAMARAFAEALGILTRAPGAGGDATQRRGVERSKEMLKGLITCGNRVLSAKQFEQLGDYFQVILRESGETDKFTHVQALTKLALFLADALRETRGGDKEPIPVLLAAPKRNRTHLVVAVLGSSRYWKSGGKSSFGNAFHEAARDPRVNARIAHDSFDSSVVVVQSDDLKNFLEGVVLNYDAI